MVDYSKYRSIKVERKDWVAVITLNKPDSFNSIDKELHLEIEEVLRDIGNDSEVRAAVITGAGSAFSAGGDVKMMYKGIKDPTPPDRDIWLDGVLRLINNIIDLDKPVIAAVNGDAVGLGATLALFCDIIIVSEKARLGDPHVRVGLVAGDGGAVIWPMLVGPALAKQYLLTGDLIPAAEAYRIGLINMAVPPEQVMPKAMEFATKLAAGAPLAIQWTKRSVNKWLREMVNLVLHTSVALEYNSVKSDDFKEAVMAFVEKRRPEFKGQ